MKYQVFTDPGHAWVRVPRADLHAVGVADKISPYSYQLNDWVYLEEDCDLGAFIVAHLESAGRPTDHATRHEWVAQYLGKTHHTNNQSRIRSFFRYACKRA